MKALVVVIVAVGRPAGAVEVVVVEMPGKELGKQWALI